MYYILVFLGQFNHIKIKSLWTIDELVCAVQTDFEKMPSCELNNVFLTLQTCMKESMKVRGGYNYQTPHIGKAKLEREGELPLQIECEESLINDVYSYLGAYKNHKWLKESCLLIFGSSLMWQSVIFENVFIPHYVWNEYLRLENRFGIYWNWYGNIILWDKRFSREM